MPERDVIRIRPTLLVGLGGTGGDVLLRIRRRFYEKFGRLEEFPIVGYLWIDTDRSEKHILAREVEEFARFADSERLILTIKDTGAVIGHLDRPENRSIREWWYPGLTKLGSVVEGAGQIRAYSRLAFFKHYDEVRAGFENAHRRVRDPLNQDRMAKSPALQRMDLLADVEFTAPTNVYLVSSIAGGTGSGMLLDVAFLMKDLMGDSRATVMAHLVFPGHFGAITNERMKANGYALLKELNHYQYGDVKFDVAWDPAAPKSIPIPPFGYCYVYDHVNDAGMETGAQAASQELIFETLADSIFKDFTHGKFADEKRSARVNFSQYLTDTWSRDYGEGRFSQKFATRYQSQGFASITVPHHRIVTACTYRLAADVVDLWGGLASEPPSQAGLPKFLAEKGLPELELVEDDAQRRHDLLFALLDPEGGADRTRGEARGLLAELTDWGRKVRQDVDRGVHSQQRRPLRDYLEERVAKERERLQAEETHPEPERWGHYPRTMRGNSERLLKSARERIRAWAFSLIDDRHESLQYVEAVLKELAERLKATAKEFEEKRGRIEGDLKTREKELENRLKEVGRFQRRGNLDGRTGIILEYLTAQVVESLLGDNRNPGVLRCEIQRRVYTEGARTARELAMAVVGTERPDGTVSGGLIDQFTRLRGQLHSLSREFRERFNYFSRAEASPHSLVLYDPEDLEKLYYPGYVKGKEDVRAVSRQVLDDLERRVSGLSEDFEAGNAARWQEALLTTARRRFARIPWDFHVLKLFRQKYDETSWKNRLRDLFLRSAFWAQAGSTPGTFKLVPERKLRMVGIPTAGPDTTPAESTEIAEQGERIRRYLQREVDPGIVFTEVPEPSEILFYQEAGGFPANYLGRVSELRTSYLKLYAEGEELHIDRHDSKFVDLAILTEAEQKALVEARRAFLLGCLFDVLQYQDDQYVFSDRQGVMEIPHPLGERAAAVVRLTSDAALRDRLVKTVEERRARSLGGGLDELARYFALLGHYKREAWGDRFGRATSENELDFEGMLAVKILSAEERDVESSAKAASVPVDDLVARGQELLREPEAHFRRRPDRRLALGEARPRV